ncbi:uncharacterized protein LOC124138025 [Haliotis rufescens]|uniref:uncharacterized protein LOC124138025 n=1 Tax=Haliotis rufescens TaxID=6454 RepID=UPI00201F1890|nr:uncharacterized protein LOC124138025 [Haliotis rufescens]
MELLHRSLVRACFAAVILAGGLLTGDGATFPLTYQFINNLTCYDCAENTKDSNNYWDPFTPCQSNLTAVPLRHCHATDKYCKVERVTVKGMTISINRDCTAECKYGCRAIGYGVTQIRCISCCRENACNTDNVGSRTRLSLTTLATMMCLYFTVTHVVR